jgi:hypothetical protein
VLAPRLEPQNLHLAVLQQEQSTPENQGNNFIYLLSFLMFIFIAIKILIRTALIPQITTVFPILIKAEPSAVLTDPTFTAVGRTSDIFLPSGLVFCA